MVTQTRKWRAKCWCGSEIGNINVEVVAAGVEGAKAQMRRQYGAEQIYNIYQVGSFNDVGQDRWNGVSNNNSNNNSMGNLIFAAGCCIVVLTITAFPPIIVIAALCLIGWGIFKLFKFLSKGVRYILTNL